MEEQLAHYFNRRIREFVEKTQKEFGSDILGFGQMVRRQEPEIWRRYSQDWDAHLQELAIDVEVKCRIVLTGVRAYPITPRR
jgi:spore germination protein KC